MLENNPATGPRGHKTTSWIEGNSNKSKQETMQESTSKQKHWTLKGLWKAMT